MGQLYKMGLDNILHRYVLSHEQERILVEADDGVLVGHCGGRVTSRKVFHACL